MGAVCHPQLSPIAERSGLRPSQHQHLLLDFLSTSHRSRAKALWNRWRHEADFHKLDRGSLRALPLVFERMSAVGIHDPAFAVLHGLSRYAWASSQYQVRAAFGAVDQLIRAGIPVCALKGYAELASAPSFRGPCRSMTDVDLLIPQSNLADAATLLQAHGWHARPPMGRRQLQSRARHSAHAHAFRRGRSEIDLHWHVLHQDRTPHFDRVAWSHMRPVLSSAVPHGLMMLSPTEHLLHLCVHGSRSETLAHGIAGIEAMQALGKGTKVDWERFVQLCVDRRLIVPIWYSLELASRYTDALPRRVLVQLAEHQVRPVEIAEHQALAGQLDAADPRAYVAIHVMQKVRRQTAVITLDAVDAAAERDQFRRQTARP